jgi:hypothetical protein
VVEAKLALEALPFFAGMAVAADGGEIRHGIPGIRAWQAR